MMEIFVRVADDGAAMVNANNWSELSSPSFLMYVDWGDGGGFEGPFDFTVVAAYHTYTVAGDYSIQISFDPPVWGFVTDVHWEPGVGTAPFAPAEVGERPPYGWPDNLPDPDPDPDPEPAAGGGYVRHRDRMVQESVQEDLVNTLIACRWMEGTTTRPVVSPYAPNDGFQVVTTSTQEILKAVKGHPVVVIDYFPEATSDDKGLVDRPDAGHVSPNTLAMDDGEAGESTLLELGSNLMEVPHRFTFALEAANVGIAQAILNDLRDRYRGALVNGDFVTLYDYNTDPDVAVVRMEVDGFIYRRAGDDEVTPAQATLYYAQLTLTDIVDSASVYAAPIVVPPTTPTVTMFTGHGPPSEQPASGTAYLDLDTGDVYGDPDVDITLGTTPEAGTNVAIDPSTGDVYQEEN